MPTYMGTGRDEAFYLLIASFAVCPGEGSTTSSAFVSSRRCLVWRNGPCPRPSNGHVLYTPPAYVNLQRKEQQFLDLNCTKII